MTRPAIQPLVGAGHPAIIRAVKIYGKEGDLSPGEETFLRAVRAADVKKTGRLEQAGRNWGFGSVAWEAVKTLAARQRDADYAKALEVFEASVEATRPNIEATLHATYIALIVEAVAVVLILSSAVVIAALMGRIAHG